MQLKWLKGGRCLAKCALSVPASAPNASATTAAECHVRTEPSGRRIITHQLLTGVVDKANVMCLMLTPIVVLWSAAKRGDASELFEVESCTQYLNFVFRTAVDEPE